MKILIVANGKYQNDLPSHVNEQIEALEREGIKIETFGVNKSGLYGYFLESFRLRRKIRECHPDIIHAHYGLSGLCANLQRRVPVVTTYHGSDVHTGGWVLLLSKIAMHLSVYNIFVGNKLLDISGYKGKNAMVLPCGIDLTVVKSMSREEAMKKTAYKKPFVLFAGSYDRPVKNAKLAKEAMAKVPDVELVELDGYNRDEVTTLMNATSCLLMTSFNEGSPMVIKEAMACGTPIVTVDVGDAKNVIGDTSGCYIADYDADDIASKVKKALTFEGKTTGRSRIEELGLSNELVAKKLKQLYYSLTDSPIK